MNKARRAQLGVIIDRLERVGIRIAEITPELEAIKGDLESVRDDEQEAFDNLPESIQSGERGQDMENGLSQLENAIAGAALAKQFDDELRKAIAERLGSPDFTLESLAGRLMQVGDVCYLDGVALLGIGPIERGGSGFVVKYTRKLWRM